MNYVDFCARTLEDMRAYIGNEGEVKLIPMQKNNGVVLDGLVIRRNDSKVSPTLYVENYYRMYNDGLPYEETVMCMIKCYENNDGASIDMDFFTDFSKVKERIVFKLIHREMNETLLKSVPHRIWNDLALVFCYLLKDEVIGSATVLIRNEHMKMWKVEEEELYCIAIDNTPRLMPEDIRTMSDVIRDMVGDKCICMNENKENAPMEEFDAANNMYVLSNTSRCFGATSILFSKHIRDLAKKYNCGLYILPSSIHEVILMPSNEFEDEIYMRQMIKDVNATEVSAEERLSDNLYYYDPSVEEIRIVAV